MRNCILIIFGINLIFNAYAQPDTIYFKHESKAYSEKAMDYVQILYNKEKATKTPVFSSTQITNKYLLQDLETISIPVFYLKNTSYKCGDNLESLIFFSHDPLFQVVLIIPKGNNKIIGKVDIFESYFERRRIIDSISGLTHSLHGYPIGSATRQVERKLLKYIRNNPDAFVFMIKGLHGYWVVRQGKVFKLLGSILGITETDGSQFICQNYGQEYINDIIKNEFRTGRAYAKCLSCAKIQKRSVFIKIE